MVEVAVGKFVEVYIGITNQTGQFTGIDGNIYIRIPFYGKLRTAGFIFLCQARHNGDNNYIFTVYSQLFCKITFGYGSEHLLRTFGCRQIITQLREVLLDKADPTGTATGHHRYFHFFIP